MGCNYSETTYVILLCGVCVCVCVCVCACVCVYARVCVPQALTSKRLKAVSETRAFVFITWTTAHDPTPETRACAGVRVVRSHVRLNIFRQQGRVLLY